MTQTTALNEAYARQADRAAVRVLALIASGLSQSKVAERVGLSRQRISQIVLRAKARGLIDGNTGR